ncbi:SEC-C metal-binding domain-containing protein [Rhodococcus kronopolitis]|uniref:SEC-C metal-binding domain-containing protein n=1 Tax=Rhodococcus kronopolitis TaxID=1460226 RepID=A0ABV9FUA5_9NOCA
MTDSSDPREEDLFDADFGADPEFGTVPEFTETAMSVLRARGPLSVDDFAGALAEQGLGSAEQAVELIGFLEDPALTVLADGRYAAADAVLEGRTLTHRLSAAEIESGILDVLPDLSPLTTLVEAGSPDDDREFSVVFPDFDADVFTARGLTDAPAPELERLLLRPDALSGCAAGDLIGIEVSGGALRLVRLDSPATETDLADPLRRIIVDGTAGYVDAVALQLMADDPTLFATPAAPLTDLLTAAGYTCERDHIAVHGFDFEGYHRATRVGMVAREHELHADEAGAVVDFAYLVREVAEAAALGEDPMVLAATRVAQSPESYAALEDPVSAAAALDLAARIEDDRTEALHAAAVALLEHAPRRTLPAAHWIAAKAADRLGDVEAAAAHYESALDRDPDWVPAIFDLALLAADGGDVTRAQSLLGRIEGGDAEALYEVLARYQPVEHPELGRNDKCWCGSGRKYKSCHLGRSDLSVDARAEWLYTKGQLFARTPELFDLVYSLAEIRAEYWSDEDGLAAALEGGLAVDVALFEAGIFDLFVSRRGDLLPPAELELARQWLAGRRSVYEVTATTPGESLTLQDVRGGDPVEVVDEWGSQNFAVGTVLCARLLPTGESVRAFGGMEPIDPSERDALLELLDSEDTEPDQLVDFLSRVFLPN